MLTIGDGLERGAAAAEVRALGAIAQQLPSPDTSTTNITHQTITTNITHNNYEHTNHKLQTTNYEHCTSNITTTITNNHNDNTSNNIYVSRHSFPAYTHTLILTYVQVEPLV